jgi:hypothetical protein
MKRNQILINKRRTYIERRLKELYMKGYSIAAAVTEISQNELFCSERTIWDDIKEITATTA